ncbi:hypothetical protein HMPREF0322_03886 [Desulfitobacterium hafniense DP7]|uniref:Uncharacterized protein n=1 Tax=Desulfitobacterium hafniense DP7 TaxID=537010 RepID=G9XSD7_DESHA|nr:hypothetical protein [Desulfitobacterium hafniense]EHL05433.1 hypothetical protein HMPREF0322_03886 [Desulfitobacterium hafniense DP7]
MSKIFEVLVFSIPEAVVIFMLASSISGRKLSLWRLVILSIFFGFIAFLIRSMLGNYVLSILCSCIFIVLLLKIMGTYELFDAITSGLMAISIYLAIEFINVKILQMVTGIEPINLSDDLRLRLLWFMPQFLVTGGLSFIIRYFVNSRSMNKLKNRGNDHENQYL